MTKKYYLIISIVAFILGILLILLNKYTINKYDYCIGNYQTCQFIIKFLKD